ncbi:hypothetical protein J31TS4_17400 [Paenibacillus sp. J31TS4]|uniref:heparinase II/III domain-containing protein n=1 Tax=Paenibacillus sp. J31TS4 TaxID=2807195 RepID=UPI001AFED65F|nr:heparinase II/III family protein [Paenibacillus sp. J31TS4]GIP38460.1 hypothetical protein J31TS4_17400 [Paenibacillus sp. J31TS4]
MGTTKGSTSPTSKERGFYFTEEQIGQAKRNIASLPWAADAWAAMQRRCDEHLTLTEEQVYSCVLGMKDEAFAYGISGCPGCGKPLPLLPTEQRAIMSGIAELPVKRVICPSCGEALPGERFADDGQGFVTEGKAYYPVGMWNFYMAGELLGGVRNHEGLVTQLTYLYMLTGEERYARRALVLLDAFSAIWPGTIGPRDFTPYGSGFEIGRLHLLTSIVYRVKVCLAMDYDWLSGHPDLDAPSEGLRRLGDSGTMRTCIECMLTDYLLDEPGGPVYDLRGGNLTNLQNHEADGVRAMLAVGLALDVPEYREWGIRVVEAYFYNAIGRDGMYYEGSYGYSLFTATVFLDIALLAMRASTEEQLEAFHPFACDRFFRLAVENPLAMLCQGHAPSYGDWGRDEVVGTDPDRKLLTEAYRAALYFYQFTPDEGMRERAASGMRPLYPLLEGELGGKGADLFFTHPAHEDGRSAKEENVLPAGATVMGQAGIAILRGRDGAAVLLRYGPNNTHGHDDVLAFTYYAEGREVSADIGYGIYGTNAHYGWASKTVAHNTVVVDCDEKLARQQLVKPFAGGELAFLYDGEDVSAMEAKAPALYGIAAYQRMLGIASAGAGSYVIDFFHVDGAGKADYAFHAFHEESELALGGSARQIEADHWTLAGVDALQKPYFDAPGLSFGERLTTGETFTTLLDGEEERLWTPEPNNGYGYIYALREYAAGGEAVRASWRTKSGLTLDWHGLDDGDRWFTGLCPSLEGERQHPILLRRSAKPVRTFVSALSTRSGDAPQAIVRMTRLPVTVEGAAAEDERRGMGDGAAAVCVELAGGERDLWFYSPAPLRAAIDTGRSGIWRVDGSAAWLRLAPDGTVAATACLASASSVLGAHAARGRDGGWLPVTETDAARGTLRVAGTLSGAPGGLLRVRRGPGHASALYTAASLQADGAGTVIELTDSFLLSKGIVDALEGDRLASRYPLPLGFAASADGPLTPFAGKLVQGEGGGQATLRGVQDLKTLLVEVRRPFAAGEPFAILDIEPGCEVQWLGRPDGGEGA